jgi:nucleoside-diphosphate kinase
MNPLKKICSAFVAALAVFSLTAIAASDASDKEKATVERTLSIIKPDAAKDAKVVEQIIEMMKAAGFKVVAQKEMELTSDQAKEFYAVHKERPFFDTLCKLMTSGKIVVLVLEKENAIADYRKLMGPTDSKEADKDTTIRGKFGTDKTANAVHGSDSAENAAKEIKFFFKDDEITG